MDLLKKSKKIIPTAMIGLILANSISPAFAHGNNEVDINSFQNAQSVTISQQVKSNEITEQRDSLNIFQESVTGRYVTAQDVLENGGVFHNPLNPEEVMFINVDQKMKINEGNFEHNDDYVFAKATEKHIDNIFKEEPEQSSFSYYVRTSDINNPDYIYLNSLQIKDFGMEMARSGFGYKNSDYAERFVLYHEFAHSMSNMEMLYKSQSKKELHSFKNGNISESFADIVGSIAVYKDMQENKSGSELDNDFRNFLKALSIIRANETEILKERKNINNEHYTEIPMFVLYNLHYDNPDLLKDIDMKEAQQLGAMIINRTLNHPEVYDVLFENDNNMHEFNENPRMKQKLFETISQEVLPEIQSMITVNENGKVSFEYNPDKKSDILKNKPRTHKI